MGIINRRCLSRLRGEYGKTLPLGKTTATSMADPFQGNSPPATSDQTRTRRSDALSVSDCQDRATFPEADDEWP